MCSKKQDGLFGKKRWPTDIAGTKTSLLQYFRIFPSTPYGANQRQFLNGIRTVLFALALQALSTATRQLLSNEPSCHRIFLLVGGWIIRQAGPTAK
jgi:hypothetical protein